ncbi:adenosylhomocysteine nucleosidase [Paenibacillus sophorae]|uniref:adenosylhomocysteine nucleosidase n=1 Tax=Paenibacillus sophorae TaxID=1333845 RepID=A0A1H8JS13_9BACL|nr:5'-methylthioadenosine/adenosylhomocysteine nucleosidase [Paenibacillus sophorae]QWU13453.1 5'-methylthioadenosine/adenosylhomocysteine nucleosidase [Paenibacillus sophorae]SEN83147.1 adenosylhomocysteine nucleosidase [Paenibacillus sophorae]
MEAVNGIIGAMDEEIKLLLEQMEHSEAVVKAGITYYKGSIGRNSIVVCKSGVGKVNAAVTTQIMIDTFGAQKILFTGVAGALHPELEVGDIVISSECMQHDMDVTALGYARGIIPYQETSVFPADPELVQFAEKACRDLGVRYVTGRILSGDQFIASHESVAMLREQLGGACAEMEGAALAQVCQMNGIPFVVIRSMSDKADGSANVSYAEFTEIASRQSHQILSVILNGLL